MENTFTIRPSVCFEVQKITGVSLGKGNLKNYQVQWAPSWISGIQLMGCERLIEEFTQQQSEKSRLVDDTTQTEVTGGSSNDSYNDNVHASNDHRHRDDDDLENLSDSNATLRQQLMEETRHKRASMVVNDDHFFENRESNCNSCSYSNNNTTNDIENVKVISMETNESNRCTDDAYDESNHINPNFEWVERNIDDQMYIDESTREDESLTFIYDNPLDDNNDDTTGGESDSSFVGCNSDHSKENVANVSKEFINGDNNLESDSSFQNDVLEVKIEEVEEEEEEEEEEEMVPVVEPKTDYTGVNRDYENKHKLALENSTTVINYKITKMHECNTCQKMFKNKSSLIRHTKIHVVGQFECNICHTKCENEPSLTKHKLTHGEETQQYPCSVCSKIFSEKVNLVAHMRIHMGKRSHKCTVCEKMFLTSSDLKRHIRVHTGERPYKCKVCEKSFKINDHLQKHSRIHIVRPSMSGAI